MATRREVTVGIFIVVGFALFLAFTVSLRNIEFLSNRHTYYVLFDRIERLEPGAAVLVRGAPAGSVSQIQYVAGPHPIMVTLRIDKQIVLYTDADISVQPAAVIGETTVNINNIGDIRKEPLAPGAEILGKAPASIETTVVDLSERIGTVLDELTPTLAAINQFVGNKENQEHARLMLRNFADASQNLNTALKSLNEQFSPIAEDLHKLPLQVQRLVDVATSTTLRVDERTADMTRNFDTAAVSWEQAGRRLDDAVRVNSEDLRRTIQRLNQLIEQNQQPISQTFTRLNRSAERLDKILDDLQRGQGTLGGLIADPRPFEQLRELLNSASSSLTGRREPIGPVAPPSRPPSRLAPAPQATP